MTTSYDDTLFTISDDGTVVKYLPSCISNDVSGGINKNTVLDCSKFADGVNFVTSYYKMHVNNTGGSAWLGIIDKWGDCASGTANARGYFTPIYSTPVSAAGEYDINVVAESFHGLEVGLFSSDFDWDASPKTWTSEDDGLDLANYPNIDTSPSSSQLTTTGIVVDITGQTSVTYEVSGCEDKCLPQAATVLTYGQASFNIGCSAAVSGASYPISSTNTCVSAASGCNNSLITLYDFNVPIEAGSANKIFALYDYRACDINNDSTDDVTIIWDSVTHPVSSTNSIVLSSGTRDNLILGVFDETLTSYVEGNTGKVTGAFETALISGGCAGDGKPSIGATTPEIGYAYNIQGPISDGPQPDYDGAGGGQSWDPSGGSLFATTFHESRFNLAPSWGKVDSHSSYIINQPPVDKRDSANSRVRITGCWFYGPVKGNVKITTQSETWVIPVGIFSWPRNTPRIGGCSMIQDVVIPWTDYPIQVDFNTGDDRLIREYDKIRFFVRVKDNANA